LKKFSATAAALEGKGTRGGEDWMEGSGTEGSEGSEDVFGSRTLEAALQGVRTF
jgi:hypothetical protein